MADVKFRTVRKLIRTTTGTEDFTVSGFGTPKAAIFITSLGRSNETQQANAGLNIGFTDGVTNGMTGFSIKDNVTTTDTSRQASAVRCVGAQDDSASLIVAGDFDSFITDGVRVDITNAPSTAIYVTCILIGGADVSDAFVGLKNLGTGTSAVDITDPGFEPDLVLLTTAGATTSEVTQSFALHSLGFAHNVGNQKGNSFGSGSALSAADPAMYTSSNNIGGQIFSGGVSWLGTVGDFDANGFSITPSASANNDFIYYLALKFTNAPDIAVFSQDGPASGGSKSFTEPGFQPDFGFLITPDSC